MIIFVLFPCSKTLFSNKKEWSNNTYNRNEFQKHAEWKSPSTKVVFYVIPFTWSSRKYKLINGNIEPSFSFGKAEIHPYCKLQEGRRVPY